MTTHVRQGAPKKGIPTLYRIELGTFCQAWASLESLRLA
jgi:hypothetical protein